MEDFQQQQCDQRVIRWKEADHKSERDLTCINASRAQLAQSIRRNGAVAFIQTVFTFRRRKNHKFSAEMEDKAENVLHVQRTNARNKNGCFAFDFFRLFGVLLLLLV